MAIPESHRDDLHIIDVRSNRVRQECLFLGAEAENSWRHQYLMYILNDKNEVLEIMQPTNQDKEACYSQIRAAEEILRDDPRVKVCVRDRLQETKDKAKKPLIEFGSFGTHKVAYEALTLDSVCNSKKCLRNNDIWVNTCPGFN
ncbi:MAG: hypothetical protein KF799_01205 [Bdellovibrionales bacterium]|nr:hypothetical protein [Bdellovibrionales bacterium]